MRERCIPTHSEAVASSSTHASREAIRFGAQVLSRLQAGLDQSELAWQELLEIVTLTNANIAGRLQRVKRVFTLGIILPAQITQPQAS